MHTSGPILFRVSLILLSFDTHSGIATEALKRDIPVVAFSGQWRRWHTTLVHRVRPSSRPLRTSRAQSHQSRHRIQAFPPQRHCFGKCRRLIPLRVQYPPLRVCRMSTSPARMLQPAESSRLLLHPLPREPDINPFTPDVDQCGMVRLPTE